MPLLLTNWEIFWDFGKVIWKILSTFQKSFYLLWIRGAVWQGVFQNSPQKYFSLHLLWIRGAVCGGVFEKFLKYFLSERKKRRSLRISPKATPLNILFGFQQLYWFAISVRNVHSILLLIMMCVAWSRGYLFLQKVRYIWATDSSNTPRICIMAKMHTAATYFNACKGIIGRMRAIPMRITK